jgi:hypothetical protein
MQSDPWLFKKGACVLWRPKQLEPGDSIQFKMADVVECHGDLVELQEPCYPHTSAWYARQDIYIKEYPTRMGDHDTA